MIKRLILSLVIIIGVSASAFAGTKALLSDSATLAANTFSSGTATLEVATTPVTTFAKNLSGFSNASMLPGQTSSHFFKLRNIGTAGDLALAAQATNVNIGGLDPSKVTITFSPWTTGTTSGSLVTGGTVTTHTLLDWEGVASLGGPNLAISTTGKYYRMDVTIDQSVTTGGAVSIFDFVFTGTQATP